MFRFRTVFFTGLAFVSCCAHLQPARAQTPLYSFKPSLKVLENKPGLGELQAKLNAALAACGQDGVGVDFHLGPATRRAIKRLRSCEGFQFPGEENIGAITPALFAALWPDRGPLTLVERAEIFILTVEGTRHTTFLWNVGQAADPLAFGTWGPYGATLGLGGEIQLIAKKIENAQPGLLQRAFDDAPSERQPGDPRANWRESFCAGTDANAPALSGAALLLSLEGGGLTAAQKTALTDEFCADDKYAKWYGAFRSLGADANVREAYDDEYAGRNARIARFLSVLYEERGWTPTEVDWVFFLDRGTQFTTNRTKARQALDALPEDATPAARRLAISRASRPTRATALALRVARDIIYLIDFLPEETFTEEELTAWRTKYPFSASQLSLSDDVAVADNPF